MNKNEFILKFKTELSAVYDESELNNIMRIYIEDFSISFPLSSEQQSAFSDHLTSLKEHIPIQYIVNNARFYDLDLELDHCVLIPRPETEEMVFLIKELCTFSDARVIDIGTGSGCIPLLLKKLNPTWNVSAVDVSAQAINVARKNSEKLNIDISISQMNFLNSEEWGDTKYDVIISNPPYITGDELERMSESTKRHEPELALFVPKENPLIFYKYIAQFAKKNITPRGHVMVEINDIYAEETQVLMSSILQSHEFRVIEDMQGAERFVHGFPRA